MSGLADSSAVDRVKTCLERIREREHEIQAWEHLDEPAALAAAHFCDDNLRDRSLHGVVVGVKDIIDTQDMPTRYGSAIYRNHQPVVDATVVTLLRRNGAVVLGKTVTTEFAGWTPSRTRNPRNTDYTPGGSSSGSAAAVAAGMVPLALGTQTLGSVIRPASYCGVVGFKPSYGWISREGVRSLADSLDTLGIFATQTATLAHLYGVLSGRSPCRDADLARTPRLALCGGPAWDHAEPDAKDALTGFAEKLARDGVPVEQLSLPAEFDALPAAAKAIHDFETIGSHETERERYADGFSESFRSGLERASAVTLAAYERAIEVGEACRIRFAEIMADYDAILTLAATGEAPRSMHTTGDSVMNAFWTLLYVPCLSLPLLSGRSGMPIGLQLVGRRFADPRLLQVALWLEKNGDHAGGRAARQMS